MKRILFICHGTSCTDVCGITRNSILILLQSCVFYINFNQYTEVFIVTHQPTQKIPLKMLVGADEKTRTIIEKLKPKLLPVF